MTVDDTGREKVVVFKNRAIEREDDEMPMSYEQSNTKDYYLGIFGLGPKPSNFSDFANPQPSLMQTMKDREKIPSISFAYTAGASYRQ